MENKNNIKEFIKQVDEALWKMREIPAFYKIDALRLLVGTAVVESDLIHKVQLKNGPARSYFQIEPSTAFDNLWNYTCYRKKFMKVVDTLTEYRYPYPAKFNIGDELVNNLEFAVYHARLKYYRDSVVLLRDSGGTHISQLAYFWKRTYNTAGGAGTEQKFIDKFNEFKVDEHIAEYLKEKNNQ